MRIKISGGGRDFQEKSVKALYFSVKALNFSGNGEME
jgi:hypothetical protein